MIDKVKKAIKKIKPDELYSPEDIHKFGVVVNTKLEPSVFTIYRLIGNGKDGKLPSVNIGTGSKSRHFVKGADLIKYLKETYQLN